MEEELLEEEYKKALERAVQAFKDVDSGKEIKLTEEEQKKFDEWADGLYTYIEKELGIDYRNMRNLTDEEEKACQRGLNSISTPTGVKMFED